MSIKFKLWIQAFIPILCVTIIGGFSVLLTTISQQKSLIEESLEANIKQLEKEIEVAVVQLEQTLKVQVKKRDFIRSVRSLYQVKNTFPALKKSFQCKAITLIRELTFKKGYDLVALYNQEGIESYATKDNIYVTSEEQPGAMVKHFSPSTGPFLKHCSSSAWTQIKSPISNLPEKLDNSSDPKIRFSFDDGQLNLIGIFPVKVVIYADGEEKTNQIGTIYLRKSFSNEFVQEFSRKTSIPSDIFSPKGEHLIGNYFNQLGNLDIDVKHQVNKVGLAEINVEGKSYFIKLSPYYQDNQPAFLMAAYSPKATVSENSKKIFIIEAFGLLGGLLFAAVVAFFTGKFISGPLKKLKDATLKIGQGDLDVEIKVDSKDEFGMLARALSKMAKDLSLITVSRNYVDDIFKTMDDCLVVISPDNLIQTVNRATCELLGYKEAAFIGKEMGDIFAEGTPKDLLDFQSILAKLTAKGTIVNLEVSVLSKNYKEIPVLFSGSIMRDIDNQVVGIVCVVKDITELKIAEQSLRESQAQNKLILDSVGEGIYGLNLEGQTTFANPAAQKMLGYSLEEMSGHTQHSLIHHTKPDGMPYPIEECSIYKCFKDGETHHKAGEIFWRKDGTSFPVEFVSIPIVENGVIVGAVVTFMDISERMKNEDLLKQYSIELENSNKELSSFASITSHDLKNPIRKIVNYCDIIEEEETELSAKTKQYLEKIEIAATHAKDLIEGILEYSQLGKDKVELKLIDLNEIVLKIMENLELELLETKGKVEFGNLPSILGNGLQIRQLFENLITNSLKYRQKGVPPFIKISHDERKRDHIQITLKDNGIGFDNLYAAKIFDPFQRLDGDIKILGSGLGLSICKKIMLGHLGGIKAEGEIGRGAKFIITFPLKEER
jgi:PAS domain S-box-containing protein